MPRATQQFTSWEAGLGGPLGVRVFFFKCSGRLFSEAPPPEGLGFRVEGLGFRVWGLGCPLWFRRVPFKGSPYYYLGPRTSPSRFRGLR